MSVIMIIFASLITAVLSIGIVTGFIFSVITAIRLFCKRGVVHNNNKIIGIKRLLLSVVCILNALSLLVGGYFGVKAYRYHKQEIWNAVEQQSNKDNILSDSFYNEMI